jgi:hypothetical protein
MAAAAIFMLAGCGSTASPGTSISPMVGSETATPPPTSTGAPTAVPTSTPSPAPLTGVLYLVALGDNGARGQLAGCGDSLVLVGDGHAPPTNTDRQIAYALQDLLALKDRFYGQSGLYNPLYQSSLSLYSVTVDKSNAATVELNGQIVMAEPCDASRIKTQIEQTARYFGASGVTVLVNGVDLDQVLSG